MKTLRLFPFAIVLLASPAFTQTSQPDSQILKDILSEIKAMRSDLRLTQTSQLLLGELQIQQTAVNAATDRRNSIRNELTFLQSNGKAVATNLAQLEESTDTSDPKAKELLVQAREQTKIQLASFASREQVVTPLIQEAELRLRNEQATLDGIQAQLSDVIKKLSPAVTQ